MADARDPRSVLDAAEQAAAAGDYPLAEQHLREAADLLEESLGPLHPDLAHTLNNLAIVCEITGKPVDAEHYFRRAYAIATGSLASDHPFVALSRKNLEDFCSARGQAVDSPPTASIDDDPVASAVLDEFPPEHSTTADRDEQPFNRHAAVSRESRPVASGRTPGLLAIGAPIAGGLLLLFIATLLWFRSNDGVESPPGTPSVSTESPSVSTESPVTTTAQPPAAPIVNDPPPEVATPAPVVAPDAPKETGTTTEVESGAAAASVQPPLVVAAQLCRGLSTRGARGEWECIPPDVPVDSGTQLSFYTRLESATATTVQHRWYRGDTLRQTGQLRIGANTTGGYRTYSRHTVQGAGDWRVELRSRDGVMLDEQRFVVR